MVVHMWNDNVVKFAKALGAYDVWLRLMVMRKKLKGSGNDAIRLLSTGGRFGSPEKLLKQNRHN